jgi:hypothetical protein
VSVCFLTSLAHHCDHYLVKPRSHVVPPRLGTAVELPVLDSEDDLDEPDEPDVEREAPPRPAPIPVPRSGRDQRIHMRFDKVFAVTVGSEIYGDSPGVARNISTGGMLVEMAEPLPLGSVITIHFRAPRCVDDDGDELVARAEVKHHYCINYARTGEPAFARAVGVRFLDFDAGLGTVDALTRDRLLH